MALQRPSTRVHAAPGGASDMASIIGGGSAPVAASQQSRYNGQSNQSQISFGQPDVSVQRSSTRVHAVPGGASDMGSLINGSAAQSSQGNGRYNGQSNQSQINFGQADMQVQRSSTRVHAAPGGASDMASIMGGSSAPMAAPQQSRYSGNGNTSQISFGAAAEAPRQPLRPAQVSLVGKMAEVVCGGLSLV
jgi:hypothetical protein